VSSWVIFEIDVNSTKTINLFVIFYTVTKNRHASAFIITLAAYGTSVSAFLICQIESFPAFYFRITNQITVYIVALVCCQNASKCRIRKSNLESRKLILGHTKSSESRSFTGALPPGPPPGLCLGPAKGACAAPLTPGVFSSDFEICCWQP
jgi:hypothetical protein